MISEFFNLRGRKSFFNRNFFIVLAIDVFLLSLSWFAAYLVRFDMDIPEKFVDEMLAILPVAILIKLLCLYYLRCLPWHVAFHRCQRSVRNH